MISGLWLMMCYSKQKEVLGIQVPAHMLQFTHIKPLASNVGVQH